MKIKNIYLLFLFLAFNNSFAQNICLKVDSIVITYIPLNISTRVSLDEYDVKNFDKKFRFKNTIVDSLSIHTFENTVHFENTDKVDGPSMDVRVIIEVYNGERCIMKILMNKIHFFSYNKKIYKNELLYKWIKELNLKNIEMKDYQYDK